ncbi:hypothetical protein PsAD2_02563 [Pseudovibrio axinellae]|uniref:Periplasmic heavy metal sensor n=1 Tax=Pseudovibrio axinellae TaxID=989403 RepID=A0A165YAU0_9HYPH|nr:LTXXQ motif family protein [Pseudovibrio axinellae]KZL18622.1 hypothetical protein PsAD2_02563 [Pseudovibrio axinellae]SER74172.1 hypothetical protein SAMN05421798_11925 [Pseudovibrio axinellae]
MFKAIALSLALLFVTSFAAHAQPHKGQRFMKMAEKLNLTEEQKEKVLPLMKETMKERRAILKDAGIERGKRPSLEELAEVRVPMQESREKLDQEMAQILKPEQMTAFRQMQQEMREKRRQKMMDRLKEAN